MERPLIPDRAADDARTSALDERPTPRRSRRPRFGGRTDGPRRPPPPDDDWYRTGATAALGGDESRYASPDDTRALPSEAGDWRQRQPSRQLVLDRYRLERRIGAGGFGVVWLAFDEKLEREVAVKVMPREDEDPVSQRAEREARVAARLNHPGIVAMYELGADEEAVYLVSELVPGRTLAELTRAGAVSDRDIARIGVALCDALAHAHQRKVIHRDVKPQN
ncbi:MAG: eukaryotic-like serine/threonine-protein kinase, partial [Thermoleophilaceae bacterium]|nr:eukaryotic-like serine/threonine-protein kinase [Thermoleophilaceae bacterium]